MIPDQALGDSPHKSITATVTTTATTNSIKDSTPANSTSDSRTGKELIPNISPIVEPLSNWTLDLPDTDHVQFFRSTNWAATSLGPLENWSFALKLHVCTIFADSRPSCLYWGLSNRIAIYNEPFIPLASNAHPTLMGTSFDVAFPELIDHIDIVFKTALATKVAADVFEIPLTVERNGYKEETYFTGSFNPLRGDDGTVQGFYNSVHEVTKQKLTDRRSFMLSRLEIPTGFSGGTFASYIIPHLESNPLDIPMAMLYQVGEESTSGTTIYLRGQIGVPEGHALATPCADLSSRLGLFPLLCKAKKEIVTLPVDDRFVGIEWRGHKDELTGLHEPSKQFSIIPLCSADRLFGFLVLGANSRRPVDNDYHQFMQSVSSRASSIAASIASAEETRQRAERLERELAESERQIRYMAQHAPVGMQHLSTEGTMLWANEKYYELTGHAREEKFQYNFSFLDVFIEEDRVKAMQAWSRLYQGAAQTEIALRTKRMFIPPSGEPEHACLLALAFPYTVNGEVKSIMACTTDISQLKWAEASEARNAEDAREAKRQQEEFIDVVSHEMRNPLSAIFQCADMISTSYKDLSHMSALEVLKNNIEASNTISMCARHQKRIVDDVLTLSKLKYMMLSISPRPVRPATLVNQVVNMFQADLISHAITIDVVAERSFALHNIDWAIFDPSRVTQILINLLTNAIKFTRGETERKIKISYGATLSEPQDSFKNLYWVPCEKEIEDLTLNTEWGTGQPVYLTCSVTDTGSGMSPEEIPRLFNRFEQANSKTSIKYGGSGLGLFISQQLTEKQGGRIGLSSVMGKGSTFGFYIKARRSMMDKPDLTKPPLVTMLSSTSIHDDLDEPDGMHVLLVEDNLVNQRILQKQLTRAGCTVHVANHGLEALEALRQSSCWHEHGDEAKRMDIILMDWEMPVMDGLTCSREIRKLEESGKITRHVEIIAITANAREEQIQEALHNGIDFVMSKPFIVGDLLLKMQERLRGIDSGTIYQ